MSHFWPVHALFAVAGAWFCIASAVAQPTPPAPRPPASSEAKSAPPAAQPAATQPRIRFKPPSGIGSASNAVAGGTRGNARELVIFVAAPPQLGLTAVPQPDLYWYVSRPLKIAPELVIVEVGGTQALVERKLALPAASGFQRISLKDLGVELQEGRDYHWQISLGNSGRNNSGAVIDASGRIRRVAMTAELAARVAGGDAVAVAASFAEAGYWYDAVMSLRDRAGGSSGFSEPETGLFESAGLGLLIRRAHEGGG